MADLYEEFQRQRDTWWMARQETVVHPMDVVGFQTAWIEEACKRLEKRDELLDRVAKCLPGLVADARQRADDCRGNVEIGSAGGYHPKLTETIELLADLKLGNEVGKGH